MVEQQFLGEGQPRDCSQVVPEQPRDCSQVVPEQPRDSQIAPEQPPDRLQVSPELLSEIVARANRAARPSVVIDGGSGAGKSSLARDLVARLGPLTQLVSLDACYPGWRGLSAAAEMVPEMLRHDEPGYWSWNWQRRARADWHPIQPDQPLVVEGCGALSKESAPWATLRIWLDLDPETRKQRVSLRDPEDVEEWWDMWAEQERRHWRLNRPWDLADLTIAPDAE